MSRTILIVDDTPLNIQSLEEFLSSTGFTIFVAEDGASALEQVGVARPDLILLDVMMPGIDGYETCRRLKERPDTRGIPVLFMTALGDQEDILRGFSAGAVDYLTKPIRQQELLARVNAHLTLAGLRCRLDEQNNFRRRLMQLASQDLLVPLSIVQQQIARLETLVPADGDYSRDLLRELVQNVAAAAAQMHDVVDQFLNPDAGLAAGPGPDFAPVDLNALAAEVVEQEQPNALRKGVTVRAQLAAALPLTHTQRRRTRQAIRNYLANALRITPSGETVSVRTRALGNRVRLEVQDASGGFTREQQAHVFSERMQTPAAHPGGSSAALDLAVVKSIIEGQGGVVGADFPTDAGAVFWFEMPVEKQPEGSSRAAHGVQEEARV